MTRELSAEDRDKFLELCLVAARSRRYVLLQYSSFGGASHVGDYETHDKAMAALNAHREQGLFALIERAPGRPVLIQRRICVVEEIELAPVESAS